jgi:hypothetical protein
LKFEWKIENVCLGIVTAAAVVLLYEGALFLRSARLDLAPIADTLKKTNSLLDQTATAEKNAIATAGQYSDQLARQASDWQKSQLQVYKAITDTKEILVRTDRSLNDVLVPRLAATLDASVTLQNTAAQNITATTARIDGTIDSLRPAIDNSIKATAAAADAMSDPGIHETMTFAAGSAANFQSMTADGAKITNDTAAFIHRETAPVRGTWNVLKKFLFEIAGPAASVATAVK